VFLGFILIYKVWQKILAKPHNAGKDRDPSGAHANTER
jgi:hypothetical protein